jgi:CDP-paratose 2-epimerase
MSNSRSNTVGGRGTAGGDAIPGGVLGNGATKRALKPRRTSPAERVVLITGGAGFIGTNLAARFLSAGQKVLVFDNLSRPGVERNLSWLKATYGDLLGVEIADVQDFARVRRAARRASVVYHFAAQVAVTKSLSDPFEDFGINARGTLNVLEALREQQPAPPIIFTSTNKVYGDLRQVSLQAGAGRYEPRSRDLRATGFSEEQPLDFHSPYGCSKGAAEQYVLDYARTFGVPAVVFRMSCIYGPHQFGTEDQGWVAHFLIRAMDGAAVTVYGDGKQVRDILFVDDLSEAFVLASQHIGRLSGTAFNIGGGPKHTVSLLELMDLIAEIRAVRSEVRFDHWRTADQQYYVSDTRKFMEATGWFPRVGVREGLERLHAWFQQQRQESAAPVIFPASAVVEGVRSPPPGLPRPVLMRRKPRSQRLWNWPDSQKEALDSKIIRFP